METCRTCAKCDFEQDANYLDLFHAQRWKTEIENIHLEFSNWRLKISQNDGLPQKICSDCFSKFCTIHTFRLECQEAQTKLNNIFDKIETQSMGDETMEAHLLKPYGVTTSAAATATIKAATIATTTQDDMSENAKIMYFSMYTKSCNEKMTEEEDMEEELEAATEKILSNSLPTASNNGNECTILGARNLKDNEIFEEQTGLVDDENNELEDEEDNKEVSIKPITATYTVNTNDKNSKQHPPQIPLRVNLTKQYHSQPQKLDDEISNTHQVDFEVEQSRQNFSNFSNDPILDLVNAIIEEDEEGEGADVMDSPTIANFIILDETGTETRQDSTFTNDNTNGEITLTFQCQYCYKPNRHRSIMQFDTQRALLAHITETHGADLPFTCPHCSQGFQDAASRTMHMKDQHIEKHYNCEVCGRKYVDRANLRHHFEKYHSDVDFECDLCEKRFISRKSLNYHRKWHNPDRQFKCSFPDCERLFINRRHLKFHEETHADIRKAEYCSFCGKSFIHLKTLRWHYYRQHNGEKPYKCGNCSEVFESYMAKRLHMLDKHLQNLTVIEKTECMVCHKRYEHERDLKEHLSKEHGGDLRRETAIITANNKKVRILQKKGQKQYSGIFQCNVCPQRFNMKSALERHAVVHSVEGRPHACPKCPKRFKRVQDMNWHMKTHSNEKPNICDVCGKGFALKYVLTQHKRSHEVIERNFKCTTCGRAYLFQKSLRVHERVHTGKTDYYKCDLCSESFVTHIKFKWHMRKKHAPTPNKRELPLDELISIVIPSDF